MISSWISAVPPKIDWTRVSLQSGADPTGSRQVCHPPPLLVTGRGVKRSCLPG
jgi:hypothetical protein